MKNFKPYVFMALAVIVALQINDRLVNPMISKTLGK